VRIPRGTHPPHPFYFRTPQIGVSGWVPELGEIVSLNGDCVCDGVNNAFVMKDSGGQIAWRAWRVEFLDTT